MLKQKFNILKENEDHSIQCDHKEENEKENEKEKIKKQFQKFDEGGRRKSLSIARTTVLNVKNTKSDDTKCNKIEPVVINESDEDFKKWLQSFDNNNITNNVKIRLFIDKILNVLHNKSYTIDNLNSFKDEIATLIYNLSIK